MRNKYTTLQISLHWIIFLLVVLAYSGMELKGFVPRSERPVIFSLHFTCGISVLVLMVARLVVRAVYRAPAIIPKPHPAITGLSHLVHLLIYLLFISLPILGLLTVYNRGSEWSAFGISMPFNANADEDVEYSLKSWHSLLANTGYFLIAAHAAGALFHHYLLKDNTLLRMLPGKGKR